LACEVIRAEVVQTSARVNPAKLVFACGTESDDKGIFPSNWLLGQGDTSLATELDVMAWYKYQEHLHKTDGNAYDKEWIPGSAPEHSGIYWCKGCGHEVVAEQSRKLPPQNHHQHTHAQGAIRWYLIVYADHERKS
jgi:hypothetical protein